MNFYKLHYNGEHHALFMMSSSAVKVFSFYIETFFIDHRVAFFIL